jgi:hypothetical protein
MLDAVNMAQAAACSPVVAALTDAPPQEYDASAAWQHCSVLTHCVVR